MVREDLSQVFTGNLLRRCTRLHTEDTKSLNQASKCPGSSHSVDLDKHVHYIMNNTSQIM